LADDFIVINFQNLYDHLVTQLLLLMLLEVDRRITESTNTAGITVDISSKMMKINPLTIVLLLKLLLILPALIRSQYRNHCTEITFAFVLLNVDSMRGLGRYICF